MLSGFAQAAPFYEKVNLLSKKQASGEWGCEVFYFKLLRTDLGRAGAGFDADMNRLGNES